MGRMAKRVSNVVELSRVSVAEERDKCSDVEGRNGNYGGYAHADGTEAKATFIVENRVS